MAGVSPTLTNMDLFSDIDLQTLLDADFDVQQQHLQQHQQHMHQRSSLLPAAGQGPSLPQMPVIGQYPMQHDSMQPLPSLHQLQHLSQHHSPEERPLGAMAAAHPSLTDFSRSGIAHTGSGSFSLHEPKMQELMQGGDQAARLPSLTTAHGQAHPMPMLPPPSALHHSSSAGAIPALGLQSNW